MNTALINGIIFTGSNIFTDHALVLKDRRIVGVVTRDAVPPDANIIDVRGATIAPGLIDLQIYGAGDQLFSTELTAESMEKIDQTLLQQGCTSYLLCLATNTVEVFKQAIAVVNAHPPKVALGLHLEGPFLNVKKRGAHPAELIIKASKESLADLLKEDALGSVKMMTVAPELLDIDSLELLREKGVCISAGHSDATFEEATRGFDQGVDAATHLFNAMSGFHHREVGLPGAVFNHPTAKASIILDGIHVSFEAAKAAKKLMGKRLFLITDAVAPCHKGIYQHVLNVDHYVLPDGTLSGSALTLLGAVKNAVEKVGIALDEALRMATTYPADLIGRRDLGRLEQGAVANVIIFNEHYQVEHVFHEGIAVV